MNRYAVRSITFDPAGGVAVEYTETAVDVRTNGVVQNHIVYVPYDSDYDESLDFIDRAVQALLDDVLDDVPNLPSIDPTPREPDDEDAPDVRPYD